VFISAFFMVLENKSYKIITIVLALIIIIAAITIIYTSLPKNENETEDNNGNQQENEVVLQMLYNDTYKNYTLDQLQELESLTDSGGYINAINVTSGPYGLTGVSISTLLEQFDILSENYSINVKAIDNYSKTFNLSYINGDIPIFNETGEQIGTGGAIMILNYKDNGEYLDDSDGPLRLAFIYENGYTSSKLWIKQVVSILVIDDF
jgi:hypothetical protein